MRSVSVDDFENNIDEMLAAAEAGDEITITRDGVPVVLLTDAADERRQRERTLVAESALHGEGRP